MLTTNQCLDKLAAAQANFIDHGMLSPTHAPPPLPVKLVDDDEDDLGLINGSVVAGNVVLARTHGKYSCSFHLLLYSFLTYLYDSPQTPSSIRFAL